MDFRTCHFEEPMRLATLGGVGAGYAFTETWQELHRFAAEQGLIGPVAPIPFLAFITLNAPGTGGPPEIASYAAALLLEPGQSASPPLEEQTIPPGMFLVGFHEGPYEGLGLAWDRFIQSLYTAGHRADPTRTCCEYYLRDPKSTLPDELLTEMCVPIAQPVTVAIQPHRRFPRRP